MSKSIYEEANTLLKAKTSVSWIYSTLLGKKANLELLHPTERKHAEEDYVAWVLYLLPIEEALEQAQKQEKLLNKIKEIIDRQDDSYISSMLEESQKYYEIKKLMVKELENEPTSEI